MLFGKLPVHGDFIARGIGAAERDALDLWLSASLSAAQETHGESFADRYDQALPWRFARADEAGWTAGAMTPSMDAAGRRFPLLAGLAGLDRGEVTAAAAAVEELLYAALAGRWDADRTSAALGALPSEVAYQDPQEGWWAADVDGARLADPRPALLVGQMLAAATA